MLPVMNVVVISIALMHNASCVCFYRTNPHPSVERYLARFSTIFI